jgi:hypothetical protein
VTEIILREEGFILDQFQRIQYILEERAWSGDDHLMAARKQKEKVCANALSSFSTYIPSGPPACGMVHLHSGWVSPC